MEELVKRLRAAAIMSEALSIFLPHSEGSAVAKLYNEAADAIEKLQKAVNFHKFNSEFWEGKYNSLADEKWIPVTERLPEKFENVLVANKRGKHYDIDKGWWNGSFFDRCAKGGYHNVTHWMPLPEPPKEE